MQKFKTIYPNLLTMTGFIILGVAIGISFGYGFVVLDEAGAFFEASWEKIESPIQFEHIADATTAKVWAITGENKYYCLGSPECGDWIETEQVSVNSHEEYDSTTISKNTCRPDGMIKYPADPQGDVVECALSIRYLGIETRSIVYHALLDDGTIWVWSSSGPWHVGLGMFILLISPIIGLVLGLLMYGNFQNKRMKLKKMNKGNNHGQ
jgi:hypothetical protein